MLTTQLFDGIGLTLGSITCPLQSPWNQRVWYCGLALMKAPLLQVNDHFSSRHHASLASMTSQSQETFETSVSGISVALNCWQHSFLKELVLPFAASCVPCKALETSVFGIGVAWNCWKQHWFQRFLVGWLMMLGKGGSSFQLQPIVFWSVMCLLEA